MALAHGLADLALVAAGQHGVYGAVDGASDVGRHCHQHACRLRHRHHAVGVLHVDVLQSQRPDGLGPRQPCQVQLGRQALLAADGSARSDGRHPRHFGGLAGEDIAALHLGVHAVALAGVGILHAHVQIHAALQRVQRGRAGASEADGGGLDLQEVLRGALELAGGVGAAEHRLQHVLTAHSGGNLGAVRAVVGLAVKVQSIVVHRRLFNVAVRIDNVELSRGDDVSQRRRHHPTHQRAMHHAVEHAGVQPDLVSDESIVVGQVRGNVVGRVVVQQHKALLGGRGLGRHGGAQRGLCQARRRRCEHVLALHGVVQLVHVACQLAVHFVVVRGHKVGLDADFLQVHGGTRGVGQRQLQLRQQGREHGQRHRRRRVCHQHLLKLGRVLFSVSRQHHHEHGRVRGQQTHGRVGDAVRGKLGWRARQRLGRHGLSSAAQRHHQQQSNRFQMHLEKENKAAHGRSGSTSGGQSNRNVDTRRDVTHISTRSFSLPPSPPSLSLLSAPCSALCCLCALLQPATVRCSPGWEATPTFTTRPTGRRRARPCPAVCAKCALAPRNKRSPRGWRRRSISWASRCS
eukprot:m.261118 g.261118  ORF g.261118 m.261118 type:complete len:574 (+) comp22745_c3_seq2:807-2528(+)